MYAQAPLTGPALHFSLDAPLPARLAVGGGTAVFVSGTVSAPPTGSARLAIVVDGDPQPVIAHGMPRLDFFGELHPRLDPYALDGLARDPDSADDPELRAYRSGFWGIARIPAGTGRVRLALQAAARRRRRSAVAELASIERTSLDPPAPGDWSDEAGAAARRHLHGHVRAARRPAFECQLDSIRAPDAPQLALRDQRRLLLARAVRGARVGRRRRSAVRGVALAAAAGLLPQLRAGAGAGAAGRRVRRAGRPGRPLAPDKLGA